MKSIHTKMNRRLVLKGMGGVALALPFLEGLASKQARAQAEDRRFAIFFRQANGVAQAQTTSELGSEPERFWPRDMGALTDTSMQGRAVDELVAHKSKLLVCKGVNMEWFDYGDGHAMGALQGLTAAGPVVDNLGGDSEAGGESLDNRIGRELNPDGRESLFMFAGQGGGWLNGPCISYRAAGQRRTALHNPWTAYQQLVGSQSGLSNEAQQQIAVRGRSVNDLVRAQLQRLKTRPELSSVDRDRLSMHLDAIRDLEVNLGARFTADQEAALQGAAPGFDSTDGDEVLQTAKLHMDVAVLAVSAGLNKSVAIQIGVGNDGKTRYRNTDGSLMENYHYISHRRLSHGADGAIISNADQLHHVIDRHFARTFRYLIEKLDSIPTSNGKTLLDEGVACWYNDNATGPPHGIADVPWILAGSCGGRIRQGQMVNIPHAPNEPTHRRLLNSIGSAVGLGGGNMTDFGDSSTNGALLSEVLV